MLRSPVPPAAVRRLLAEIESSSRGEHVLAVGGTSELASELRQQLLRGRADAPALRVGDPDGAVAYVHVLSGAPREEDVGVLRRARRARVPAIVVAAKGAEGPVPYVLETDVLRSVDGQEFPLEAIARSLATRLGEDGAPLAARVPLLRQAVCERLVTSCARRNGVLAAARPPGPDFPALALTELRLVLRLAQAHGLAAGQERLPELAATLGAGLGLRALARALRSRVAVPDWALEGAVAYAGTRALGEAARLLFATRRPDGAGRAAP
jgi:uncharacterized protein (DUF697 family)